MIGRGIATAGIWISPGLILYSLGLGNGDLEVPGLIAAIYGVFMLMGTLIVWAGTVGKKDE